MAIDMIRIRGYQMAIDLQGLRLVYLLQHSNLIIESDQETPLSEYFSIFTRILSSL